VRIWEHEQYETTSLILLEDIVSPNVLCEATVAGKKRWVSVFLNHVRIMLFSSSC
jgi:hypothetical protein